MNTLSKPLELEINQLLADVHKASEFVQTFLSQILMRYQSAAT
jgi:hypothetical protein